MAVRTYKAETKWLGGTKAKTRIREFKIDIDEPLELKGTNTAPNPVEILLAALGGCVALTYHGYAKKLEVDIIPGGWIDEENRKRRGFKQIRYEVQLKTKASKEKIHQLHKLVEEKCPISDMLNNNTEIKGRVSVI